MTRAEHMAWAKQRAMETFDYYAGQPGESQDPAAMAVASMASDLTKHDETQDLGAGVQLGTMELMSGHLRTREQVERWVMGFPS